MQPPAIDASPCAVHVVYRFAGFEVDTAGYELRYDGQPIRLARQPMDLLLLLLERQMELVSRDEIVRRLWVDTVFTDLDAGIRTAVLKIRRALGESGRFVETVPGKGYRFTAPVQGDVPRSRRQPVADMTTADRVSVRSPGNLPAEVTSFVGRRDQLLELTALVGSTRLLTLTGSGGVGKTRLALRVARDLVDRFIDGAWFIDLAPLSVASLLGQTIATTLGIRERPDRLARDTLLDALRDREALLVLDTCEHLIEGCAELVDVLHRGCPALSMIATSREPLGLPGETIRPIPSLAVPKIGDPVDHDSLLQAEAAHLFAERARAVNPAFSARDHAYAIAQICRRLDGIPLAIELAAARVAVISPEQIAARLHDRFRLLTGGARTAVARQRTLEGAVDWSYQLLSEAEKQLYARLSVFPGTWSLRAMERICGGDGIGEEQILDLLSSLVTKSLVVVDHEFGGEHRYRLLETVRQHARERLMQSGSNRWHDRHFDFFFSEFRRATPVLRHRHQLECLHRLGEEQENVRFALEWALGSPALAEKGLELAGALFWFWTKRGLFEEGKLWLQQALAVPGGAPRLRARALIGLSHMHHFQGLPFEREIAEALATGRATDDAWVISFALFMQALAAWESGDYEHATRRALEARAAALTSGEDIQHGGPLMILAAIAECRGDLDGAQQMYAESIDVHRRAGDGWGLSILLSTAAGLSILRKDYREAHAQAVEALAHCEALDDPRGIAWSLEVFAGVCAGEGHAAEAAMLCGASDRLVESVGGWLSPQIRSIRSRYLEGVETALGKRRFSSMRALGRAMPLNQALALARQSSTGHSC